MGHASSSTSRWCLVSCGIPLARWVCWAAMPTARMCSAASAEQGISPRSLALRPAATSRTSPSCRTFGTPLARWACSAVGQMEYMPSAAFVGTVPTRASSARRWWADAQGTPMPVLVTRARRSARSRTSPRCPSIGTPSALLASWAAWPTASTRSAASARSDPSRGSLVPTTSRPRRTGARSPLAASPRSRTFGMRLVRWGCWAAGPTTFTRSAAFAVAAVSTKMCLVPRRRQAAPSRRCRRTLPPKGRGLGRSPSHPAPMSSPSRRPPQRTFKLRSARTKRRWCRGHRDTPRFAIGSGVWCCRSRRCGRTSGCELLQVAGSAFPLDLGGLYTASNP
mmetsp:Transcript_5340/g.13175  ORF Transcript_5340/g.13175 Transcript_5340/m.13175 type:complete len:337 (-) Transcript_5340:21-1031(-)